MPDIESNFNPRSLTGATIHCSHLTLSTRISIHAPLRERPHSFHPAMCRICISIHAPLRERPFLHEPCSRFNRFQSTLPYGSDPAALALSKYSSDFNPRSLTGATRALNRIDLKTEYFNPRSLTGATKLWYWHAGEWVFQSTLPYGSDSKPQTSNRANSRFQSTLPYGSDDMISPTLFTASVFQSTLPYGSDCATASKCHCR